MLSTKGEPHSCPCLAGGPVSRAGPGWERQLALSVSAVKDKEDTQVDSEARPMKDETFGEYR